MARGRSSYPDCGDRSNLRVWIVAGLSMFFGAIGAILALSLSTVDSMPRDPDSRLPGVVYQPAVQVHSGSDWRAVLRMLEESVTELEVSEGLINAWAQQQTREWRGSEAMSWWLPGQMRFYLRESGADWIFEWPPPPGFNKPLILQTRWRYSDAGGHFDLERAWLGQFPLSTIPGVGNWLARSKARRIVEAEDLLPVQAELIQLYRIEGGENRLRLIRR